MKHPNRPTFARVCGGVLVTLVAILVGFAGVLKLADLAEFKHSTESWTIIPGTLRPAMLGVPFLEIIFAACWLAGLNRRAGLIGLGSLLSVFTAALAAQIWTNKPPDCNCFGKLMAFQQLQNAGHAMILRNVMILSLFGLGCFLWCWSRQPPRAQAIPRVAAAGARSGFSLIELIVVIAIIAIVVALTAPGLGVVKRYSQQTASLANLRQHTSVFAAYNADFQDAYPLITDPRATYSVVRNRTHGLVVTHLGYFSAHIVWHIALSDQYYEGQYAHRSFWPPTHTGGGDSGPMLAPLPYLYACSFLARPEYWNPATRTNREQWGVTRADETRYPASKILLGSPPDPLTSGPALRTPMGFCDGSARAVASEQIAGGYNGGDGTGPLNDIQHRNREPSWCHTLDGVRGRDVN